MAGLYHRGINPNFTSPTMQVAASQGAGGAVPRGASPQIQQDQSGLDVSKLGGLLGMMAQNKKDPSGFGLSSGVPVVNDSSRTAAGDVLGGLANANNGMSYEALPPQWMDSLSNGWDALKGMFGFGA